MTYLTSILFISFLAHTSFVQESLAKASYFPKDFSDSKKKWKQFTSQVSAERDIQELKLPSQSESEMFIDTFFAPAQKKPTHLFIMSSGVHGVEAFAGSAIQMLFLDKIFPSLDRKHLSVLLIHNINPWGFKNLRRVSENNVDLNRNFDINDRLFKTPNPGYRKIKDLINPQKPVDLSGLGYYLPFIDMIQKIIEVSIKPLRQSILQGQYAYPKALYFGGRRFEPQNMILGKLLKKQMSPYKNIFMVDLHTGYGEKGKLHLFGSNKLNKEQKRKLQKLFLGKAIDTGDDKDFYATHGDFTDFAHKLKPKGSELQAITFEFGTMDSQTHLGALRSIRTMILENQGHHYGYKTPNDKKKVQELMQKMYYPQSSQWRKKVLNQAQSQLEQSIKAFLK